MEEQEEPLVMMELLFGASAQAAQREAPERLLRWRRAFQDWLEEIATMRYTMRNVHKWALETEDTRELVRMAGIYSTGCGMLVKLLKMEKGSSELLTRYVNELIENAIKEAGKQLGIG